MPLLWRPSRAIRAPHHTAIPVRPASEATACAGIDDDTEAESEWQVVAKQEDAEESVSDWTSKARDQAEMNEIKKAIEEGLMKADEMVHVGAS